MSECVVLGFRSASTTHRSLSECAACTRRKRAGNLREYHVSFAIKPHSSGYQLTASTHIPQQPKVCTRGYSQCNLLAAKMWRTPAFGLALDTPSPMRSRAASAWLVLGLTYSGFPSAATEKRRLPRVHGKPLAQIASVWPDWHSPVTRTHADTTSWATSDSTFLLLFTECQKSLRAIVKT